MEPAANLVMDLSDDDEDDVARTIQLQKSLISESQSLHHSHIEVIRCDSLPQGSDSEEREHSQVSTETENKDANDSETSYSNALAANIEYDNLLARLESNLKALISECKSDLYDIEAIREGYKRNEDKKCSVFGRSNYAYLFGAPYFKTRSYYPCPVNADTVSKKKNNELSWIDLPFVCWWSPLHLKLLVDSIKDSSLKACKIDAQNYKNALQRRYNALSEDAVEEKKKLEEEIKNFDVEAYVTNHLNEKIASTDHDWLKLSASVLNGKHTADECRGFWYNYLHPKFYKGNWTDEESEKLQKLAEENNFQNWDFIAEELGTKRSGYQCFAQFKNQAVDQSKQKWSKAEDELLKSVVEKLRVGDYIPWSQVAMHINGRSKTQVYNRWTYCLNPKIKKGRFTLQEDVIILCGVKKWGEDFQRIAQYMPNRKAPQLRTRYHTGISKTDLLPWTAKEDGHLLELVDKYGHDWRKIAEHFPGKSNIQVRHRHDTVKRWIQANPGRPLTEITSRRTIKSGVYDRCPDLWAYAEKLLKGGNPTGASTSLIMPKPLPTSKGRRVRKLSAIDEKLSEFFKGTFSKPSGLSRKFSSMEDCDSKVNEINLFLKMLQAKLDIPDDETLDDDNALDMDDRELLRGLRSLQHSDEGVVTPTPSFDHTIAHDVSSIDYVQPSDPSSTQLSLNYSFEAPCAPEPVSQSSSVPEVFSEVPDHPVFGNAKYLCPPNFTTLVGLRSILLGKRKLVESMSEFSTDPILLEVDDTNNETLRRAKQLWDDRLMCLFALPNLLYKVKPSDPVDPASGVAQQTRGLPPLRGVSPDLYEIEDEPVASSSGGIDVQTMQSDINGSDYLVRTKGTKRKQPDKRSGEPAKKQAN